MNKPICCGKLSQPVKEVYGKLGRMFISADRLKWFGYSYIIGFRCRVCGHFGVPYSTEWDNTYMNSLEAVRQEGLAFDATFN